MDTVAEEISGEHFERLRAVLDDVPFARFLGIELVSAKHGSATLRFAIRRDLIQNYGLLHGGAMASLIDTATAFAIVSQLSQPEKFTTVDLNVNYLRPITEGSATCTARVIRAGRRILTLTAEVHDDAGNLVAVALSTYIRLAK
jgi:uncharacterized protein (TIGR00369 family)